MNILKLEISTLVQAEHTITDFRPNQELKQNIKLCSIWANDVVWTNGDFQGCSLWKSKKKITNRRKIARARLISEITIFSVVDKIRIASATFRQKKIEHAG